MVLKHATRETEKTVETRRQKNQAKKAELNNLKNALGKKSKKENAEVTKLKAQLQAALAGHQKKFDGGFSLALILLCRSYEPLHEHAFNIFEEAGYSIEDFDIKDMDPTDLDTLKKIFSI